MSNKPNSQPTHSASHHSASHGPLLSEIQTETSSEAAPLLNFLTTHALKIIGFLALFVLAVGGFGAYKWYDGNKLEQAQATLASITMDKKGEDRLNALEDFLKVAPKELQVTILLNMAVSAMQDQSYTKAADFYGRIVKIENKTAVGFLCTLNQAQALMFDNKNKEALPILQTLLAQMSDGQKLLIQQSIVEAALQSGDITVAKATLEDMAKATTGPEAELYRHRAKNIISSTSQAK